MIRYALTLAVVLGAAVAVANPYGMFGQMPGNALLVFELATGTQTADSVRGASPAASG